MTSGPASGPGVAFPLCNNQSVPGQRDTSRDGWGKVAKNKSGGFICYLPIIMETIRWGAQVFTTEDFKGRFK